jgi:hypothetical protein
MPLLARVYKVSSHAFRAGSPAPQPQGHLCHAAQSRYRAHSTASEGQVQLSCSHDPGAGLPPARTSLPCPCHCAADKKHGWLLLCSCPQGPLTYYQHELREGRRVGPALLCCPTMEVLIFYSFWFGSFWFGLVVVLVFSRQGSLCRPSYPGPG